MPKLTLSSTMRKWNALKNALNRTAAIIRRRDVFEVMKHNVPSYPYINWKIMNALGDANVNNTNRLAVMMHFAQHPELRIHVNRAYKRIPDLTKEMNQVARKIMATRTIQKRWRSVAPQIRNKKRLAVFQVLNKKLKGKNVSHSASIILPQSGLAKPVYGPLTLQNTLRRKYKTY